MIHLAQGDLPGARAAIHAAPAEVEPTALVAFIGNYWDLHWVLDDAQQQLLLRLGPALYDGDRGTWGIVRASTYYLRGDKARARVYADSARLGIEETLKATPDDGQRVAFLGLALAYLGRNAEAVKEGERAVGALADRPRRLHRSLHPAPARPDLHRRGPAGQGGRPARGAAQDAVFPLARLAPDRSQLRVAARQPAVPEAGGGDGVGGPAQSAECFGSAARRPMVRTLAAALGLSAFLLCPGSVLSAAQRAPAGAGRSPWS